MPYTIQQSTAREQGKCRAVTCCGLDDPLANYSSDHEELDAFISVAFSDYFTALGVDCEGKPCTVVYGSSVSQADADAQASLAALQCSIATCEDEDGNELELFYNQEVSCSTPCSSGGSLTTIVPAGTYYGITQEQADGLARANCNVNATNLSLCIVGSFGGGCVGDSYLDSLLITSSSIVVDAYVASGSLPAGLSLSYTGSSVVISGTPTTCETTQFALSIVDDQGNVGTRSFSITILEITTDTITTPVIGEEYIFNLDACGGSGDYEWQLLSGSLPTGLTLSEDGVISGTPTSGGTFNFTIRVTDGTAADIPPIEPDDEPQPVALYAYFAFIPQYGSRPATVQFQDQSIGENIIGWLWDFGDGYTSTERNPSHSYLDDGETTYTVTLTAFNGSISDTISRILPFGQGRIRINNYNSSQWQLGCSLTGTENLWDGTFRPWGYTSTPFGYLYSWKFISSIHMMAGGIDLDEGSNRTTCLIVKDTPSQKWRMIVVSQFQRLGVYDPDPERLLWYGIKNFNQADPLRELPIGTYNASTSLGVLCIPFSNQYVEYY